MSLSIYDLPQRLKREREREMKKKREEERGVPFLAIAFMMSARGPMWVPEPCKRATRNGGHHV